MRNIQPVVDIKQEEIQKNKERKRQNRKIGISVIVAIVLVILICNADLMEGRTTYASEAEMKKALQGTYTYYNNFGIASKQIIFSEDLVIYKGSYEREMETTIREWNYKEGIVRTFEDIIVTNDGNLKSDGKVYYKGGTM